MVRQCQMCKKLDYLNPDLSFHRFPANMERRNIWYALLGFDLCSNHFNDSDFQYKSNGLKYLKVDANPKSVNSEIFLTHASRCSTTSTSTEHSDGELSTTTSLLQDSPNSKRCRTELPLNIIEKHDAGVAKTDSSTTLSASESEQLSVVNLSQERQPSSSKSEFRGKLPAPKKR